MMRFNVRAFGYTALGLWSSPGLGHFGPDKRAWSLGRSSRVSAAELSSQTRKPMKTGALSLQARTTVQKLKRALRASNILVGRFNC